MLSEEELMTYIRVAFDAWLLHEHVDPSLFASLRLV
jgi:hypothetical protein